MGLKATLFLAKSVRSQRPRQVSWLTAFESRNFSVRNDSNMGAAPFRTQIGIWTALPGAAEPQPVGDSIEQRRPITVAGPRPNCTAFP